MFVREVHPPLPALTGWAFKRTTFSLSILPSFPSSPSPLSPPPPFPNRLPTLTTASSRPSSSPQTENDALGTLPALPFPLDGISPRG